MFAKVIQLLFNVYQNDIMNTYNNYSGEYMENRKDQYKLYKSGKLWITATVAMVLFNASVTVVSADDGKTTEQSSLVQNDKDVALVSENPSDNQTSMAVDDTEIVSAVESAESMGVVVKQEPTRSNIVSDSENTEDIAKVKNDIASDYEQQIAELQNAEKTQQQNNQQFNQHTEEYESALHKGKQQNKDGKTQIATSAAKQALDFDTSKPADESSPTSNIEPSKICTGIGSHSNLSDSTKVWEYVGPQVLNATIEKTWPRSGSIEDADGNKRSVDFHEIFHDFQLQNGNWNDTNNYKESGIPHLAISSNAVDNIWATNLNWQTTFWFTYSDSHEVVPISKVPGSNEEPKVYFLSGSLSSTNFAGPEWDNWNGNRKEYVQTNDAKTAIINEQSTIGLDYISADGIADNAPDGLAYVNTSADFQSPNWDEDTNPQHYAIEESVSFTDFTTDKPTLYIGAVPMNKNTRWWHENHNMNSDELAFLKKPEKIDPVTVTYHLNTITYEKNNNIQPLVAEITDSDPEVHQENEVSNDTRIPENNQKGYGAATSPALTESSVKNQSEVTVHYVLKRINGKELQSTQTIKGTSGQSYYDEVGNFISNNSDEDVTTYEIPETFNQEVAGITNSNDGLLHYTYTADGNGGVFTEQKNISNPKQNVWVIYTYSIDGKNGQDGKDGVNGIDGQNGVDGKNGVNGIDGQNGVNGKDGVNGIDGQNGVDGKDGVNGIDGQNGVDGKDGINGIDGQNGVDGKDGVNGINGQNGVDGKDGVNGIDGKNSLNNQEASNSIEDKDVADSIDTKKGRDNTENFKSNTLSTSKTSGDAIEEMIVKEECSPTENNNQVQEKQVSANDADNVPNQGLESYYQADNNSDQRTFSADQLKKNDLAAIIGETSSYHKSEQNQNEGKTLHTDNLESKDNANDVVSQKDIEKQKINQSKNNGLQLPKTNGHRYFASALEAVILAMLLIISKVYKKIRI